jgi:hypothetical protein
MIYQFTAAKDVEIRVYSALRNDFFFGDKLWITDKVSNGILLVKKEGDACDKGDKLLFHIMELGKMFHYIEVGYSPVTMRNGLYVHFDMGHLWMPKQSLWHLGAKVEAFPGDNATLDDTVQDNRGKVYNPISGEWTWL